MFWIAGCAMLYAMIALLAFRVVDPREPLASLVFILAIALIIVGILRMAWRASVPVSDYSPVEPPNPNPGGGPSKHHYSPFHLPYRRI